jgi:protein SCO1/2
MKYILFFGIALTAFWACDPGAPRPLPILGERDVVNGDTVYPTIPDFSFVDQDSQAVTNATFQDKIYVVDFFLSTARRFAPR